MGRITRHPRRREVRWKASTCREFVNQIRQRRNVSQKASVYIIRPGKNVQVCFIWDPGWSTGGPVKFYFMHFYPHFIWVQLWLIAERDFGSWNQYSLFNHSASSDVKSTILCVKYLTRELFVHDVLFLVET